MGLKVQETFPKNTKVLFQILEKAKVGLKENLHLVC
jgi:hypothetical protein